jgi:hypothetical protein
VPPQPVPAVSGVVPQRAEPPKRVVSPVIAPRENAPQRGERAPGELKDRKVWKVTTPEGQGDTKEKEHKDKERK